MTKASIEANSIVALSFEALAIFTLPLECVPCIQYPVRFKKNEFNIQILINSSSKVNIMAPAYTVSLGLKIWPSNIRAQKIDCSTLQTFGMVLANFKGDNKLDQSWFF